MIDRDELSRMQTWSILAGAAMMLSLSMGMRQSFGLFQPHMIRDIGITAADFSLAIAIQNIVWGVTQPFVGAAADRHGAGRIAMAGVLVYAAGIVLSVVAKSALVFTLGAGYFLTDSFMLGIEARNKNEFEGAEELESSILSAGPVVALTEGRWWFAFTFLPQLVALKGKSEGRSLDLEHAERFEARLILGLGL